MLPAREERAGNRKGKRPKWVLTPELERELRRLYAEPPRGRRPALRRLSAAWNIPRWRLGRWAAALGCYQTVRKPAPWSAAELALLERNAHLGLDRLALKLRRAGYPRTHAAIKIQLTRRHLRSEREGYTARSVAMCFGVDPTTVVRWIRMGMLRAKPRGTLRTAAQGGDQWLVLEPDLRRFVLEHLGEIHLGKVDKHWFVSLLTSGRLGAKGGNDE
ncbi:MAG: hypothetical protein AB1578_20100 [Thermodesulfobacteriota bacterium]